MKNFTVLILIFCSAVAHSRIIQRNSTSEWIWGQIATHDHVLYREMVVRNSSGPRNRVTVHFKYPKQGMINRRRITAVQVWDHYGGNTAQLIKGGADHRFAEVRLTSQVGHGLNFTVEIAGR